MRTPIFPMTRMTTLAVLAATALAAQVARADGLTSAQLNNMLAAGMTAPMAGALSQVAGQPNGLAALNAQAQLVAAPTLAPLRQQLWQSVMPFWGEAVAPAQTTQLTLGENFSLDGRFTAIQLIFANPGTAVTLPAVTVAPSASAGSRTTPVDAAGNTIGWTAVSLGGASAIALPAGTAARPSLTLSDPLPLQSLARSDGGSYALLYTRVLSPASGTSWTADYLTDLAPLLSLSAYTSASGGRSVALYFGGGDFVSQPAVATLLTDANAAIGTTFSYVAGVRYLSPDRVVTIMGCGDSLTAGFSTQSGYAGFGLQASVALSRQLGIGVSYVAHGYPGQSSADFAANCRTAANLLHPAVVTLPVDSPNDWTGVGNTASGTAAPAATAAQDTVRIAMQQRALDLADTVLSYGGLPVLLTPIPFAGYDAAGQYGAERAQAGAFARLLSARGGLVLDAQAILSGYVPSAARVPTLPATCLAPDGAHLNDACQGRLGAALAQALMPRL